MDMTGTVLLKHIHLVLAVLFLLHVQGARIKMPSQRQFGRIEKCKLELSKCLNGGGYACHGTGYKIKCYSRRQRCDGYYHCPYGDDERFCDFFLYPNSKPFKHTETVHKTSTTTTTSTTTITSSTVSTSTSTHTTISTSFTKPTFALDPSSAFSTATLSTSLGPIYRPIQIPPGSPINAGSTCQLVAAVPGDMARANDYFLTSTISIATITASLTAVCSPTTTTIRC